MNSAAEVLDAEAIARAISIPSWFRLDVQLRFVDARPIALLEHWQSRFRGELLPCRAQFDPLQLKEHLGHLIILKADAAHNDFRYRLVGTEIVEQIGRDVTGKLIGEAYDARAVKVIKYLAEHRIPGRIFGRVDWQEKDYLHYETLLLPLADDGYNVDCLLGEMVFPPHIDSIV